MKKSGSVELILSNRKKIQHVMATPFKLSMTISGSSEAAGVTSFLAETASSVEERELAIDEEVVENVHTPEPPMARSYDFEEGEGEECVKMALEQ